MNLEVGMRLWLSLTVAVLSVTQSSGLISIDREYLNTVNASSHPSYDRASINVEQEPLPTARAEASSTTNFNIRLGPSTNDAILGTFEALGLKNVQVLGKVGEWYFFRYDHQNAFVHRDLLVFPDFPDNSPPVLDLTETYSLLRSMEVINENEQAISGLNASSYVDLIAMYSFVNNSVEEELTPETFTPGNLVLFSTPQALNDSWYVFKQVRRVSQNPPGSVFSVFLDETGNYIDSSYITVAAAIESLAALDATLDVNLLPSHTRGHLVVNSRVTLDTNLLVDGAAFEEALLIQVQDAAGSRRTTVWAPWWFPDDAPPQINIQALAPDYPQQYWSSVEPHLLNGTPVPLGYIGEIRLPRLLFRSNHLRVFAVKVNYCQEFVGTGRTALICSVSMPREDNSGTNTIIGDFTYGNTIDLSHDFISLKDTSSLNLLTIPNTPATDVASHKYRLTGDQWTRYFASFRAGDTLLLGVEDNGESVISDLTNGIALSESNDQGVDPSFQTQLAVVGIFNSPPFPGMPRFNLNNSFQ